MLMLILLRTDDVDDDPSLCPFGDPWHITAYSLASPFRNRGISKLSACHRGDTDEIRELVHMIQHTFPHAGICR